MSGGQRARAVSVTATLAIALAAVVAPWWGHVDDGDAQLYRVVARHMVEDATCFELRYLPGVHETFREHLPFGLWPYALGIRILGEGALPAIGALFTLGTLALVLATGWRLAGPAAGILSVLVLSATESFAVYGGREKLDPPLLFFATAAVAPLLVGALRAQNLALASAFGAAAALVKGPFGILPLCAAATARALQERTARSAVQLGVVMAASTIPLVGFLVWSRSFGDRSWWDGYVMAQLWASASGGRTDGNFAPWFPLATLAGRFWPGLPLAGLGAWMAVRGKTERRRELRLVAVAAAIVIAGLCVPTRKLWSHALVAYPLLALLAGVAVGPWLERHRGSPARGRIAVGGLSALAVAMWIAAALGAGKLWLKAPCIAPGAVDSALRRLRPGTEVLVVATPFDWKTVAALASERRLVPWPMGRPDEAIPPESRPALALVREVQLGSPLRGWREVARSGGWVALEAETIRMGAPNP
ncbi:MAG TPA: hypothetical protein VE618_06525, partial [Myxococcaceae bacterium]|nr:hypothetical protein [Myxococcaceae bacterium]